MIVKDLDIPEIHKLSRISVTMGLEDLNLAWKILKKSRTFSRCSTTSIFSTKENLRWCYFIFNPENLLETVATSFKRKYFIFRKKYVLKNAKMSKTDNLRSILANLVDQFRNSLIRIKFSTDVLLLVGIFSSEKKSIGYHFNFRPKKVQENKKIG